MGLYDPLGPQTRPVTGGASNGRSGGGRVVSPAVRPYGGRSAARRKPPLGRAALWVRAGAEGLEPPTPGFGDQCSAKLSYAPIRHEYSIGSAGRGCQSKRYQATENIVSTDRPPSGKWRRSKCCRPECQASGRGRVTLTRVPSPGVLRSERLPPSKVARSCMPITPMRPLPANSATA